MYLGHGDTYRYAICVLLNKVSFRVRYGAPKVRSSRKVWVKFYRRTPRIAVVEVKNKKIEVLEVVEMKIEVLEVE